MRTCVKCGQSRYETEFRPRKCANNVCKSCDRAYRREYYRRQMIKKPPKPRHPYHRQDGVLPAFAAAPAICALIQGRFIAEPAAYR